LAVNVNGTFYVTQCVLASLKPRTGQIVIMGSVHGKEAPSEDDAPSVDPTQDSSANSTAGAVDAEISDKPKAK
jgi:hypothetical protein